MKSVMVRPNTGHGTNNPLPGGGNPERTSARTTTLMDMALAQEKAGQKATTSPNSGDGHLMTYHYVQPINPITGSYVAVVKDDNTGVWYLSRGIAPTQSNGLKDGTGSTVLLDQATAQKLAAANGW